MGLRVGQREERRRLVTMDSVEQFGQLGSCAAVNHLPTNASSVRSRQRDQVALFSDELISCLTTKRFKSFLLLPFQFKLAMQSKMVASSIIDLIARCLSQLQIVVQFSFPSREQTERNW